MTTAVTKAPPPHRIDGWPLLALLDTHQPPPGDERATQNLLLIFQLQTIHAMYEVLKAVIPGNALLLPMVIVQGKGEGIHDQGILWIGEHDPFGLDDTIVVYARTRWDTADHGTETAIQVSWHEPDGMMARPAYSEQIKLAAKWIAEHVSEDDFDTAARRFWKLIGVKIKNPKFRPACWFGTVSGHWDYGERPSSPGREGAHTPGG